MIVDPQPFDNALIQLMLRHALRPRNGGRVYADNRTTDRLCWVMLERGWITLARDIRHAWSTRPVFMHYVTEEGRNARTGDAQ